MAIDSIISSGKSLLVAGLLVMTACSQQAAQMADGNRSTISPLILLSEADAPNQDSSSANDILRISAVGDIMLGGTSEPVMETFGYDYAFEQVKYLFDDSDIVIGNLEGPLTHRETPYANKEYLFKTPPEKVAPALRRAGFNMMNLANNHIMDFGPGGMTDTLDALHGVGIQTVGTGDNLEQARRGTLIKTGELTTGFLSYSLTFPKSFWADTNKPGTAFGHEHQIRADVRRMKESADIVVVSFHWGQEKNAELRDYQPILAHAAIDEGAALVLGHHPHVLQAVEKYRHGVILYSLGNFTFGSYSRIAESSIVATAVFHGPRFHALELIPIKVLNIDVNFQPHLLLGQEADQVIEHLNRLSMQRNTRLDNNQGVAYLYNHFNMSESVSVLH